jgi:cell division protein FtsI (penicillin-binding protein 3)
MASMDKSPDGGAPVPSSYNKALTNVFEPGSANKIITMAAALEEGVTTPQSQLEVPDKLKVSDFTFTDHDPHATQLMTPTDILATSSNIGTIMLGQALGPERLDSYLHKFGFGNPTALSFPDESGGLLLPLNSWSGTSIATIPIGQGVAITALQMLQAFNVIANGGVYVEPKLVLATIDQHGKRHDTPAAGSHQVVSTPTANQVRDMMVAVVQQGTGKQAAIEGYTVGGKTGTARKPQPNGGYMDGAGHYHYVATFAGFTPAEDPTLSAIVAIDEPSNDIYASDVSAPVFSRIVSYALRRFEVPPPGIVLRPTVPAPTLTGADVVVPAADTKVRQDAATAPTTTTTTLPPTSATRTPTTAPAATGPPGKKP